MTLTSAQQRALKTQIKTLLDNLEEKELVQHKLNQEIPFNVEVVKGKKSLIIGIDECDFTMEYKFKQKDGDDGSKTGDASPGRKSGRSGGSERRVQAGS